MRFVFALLASATLWGQSWQLPPSTAARGGTGSLLILFKAPPGKQPGALQWKLSVPAEVTIDPGEIVAGTAAESAQKSIRCATQGKTPQQNSTYSCILAGGRKPIPNGIVAVIKYRVSSAAHRGVARVRVEDAMGVSADLSRIEITPAEGTISVR